MKTATRSQKSVKLHENVCSQNRRDFRPHKSCRGGPHSNNLIAIDVRGVEKFGVAQTETYLDKIDQSIELIATNPKIARLRHEIRSPVRILHLRHHREGWLARPLG